MCFSITAKRISPALILQLNLTPVSWSAQLLPFFQTIDISYLIVIKHTGCNNDFLKELQAVISLLIILWKTIYAVIIIMKF